MCRDSYKLHVLTYIYYVGRYSLENIINYYNILIYIYTFANHHIFIIRYRHFRLLPPFASLYSSIGTIYTFDVTFPLNLSMYI